jgi:RHS repeat-associated protein
MAAFNGATSFTNYATNRFVYDGWNLIAELDHQGNVLRSYAWGQDLSGGTAPDEQNAGGVGGLLMVRDHAASTVHFAGYDGNGNVTALVMTDGTPSARYEYSPFDELLRSTGPLARSNPFRWSTKFIDEESGLVYYGYRYYSPTLGKWIGRDPIEEGGGLNLYTFVENGPINWFDLQGNSKKSIIAIIDAIVNVGLAILGKDLKSGGTQVQQEMEEAIRGSNEAQEGEAVPGGKGGKKKPKKMFVFKGNWDTAKSVRSGAKLKAMAAIGVIGYVLSDQAEADAASFATNFRDNRRQLDDGDVAMADLDAAMMALDALNLFGNSGIALEIWGALPE